MVDALIMYISNTSEKKITTSTFDQDLLKAEMISNRIILKRGEKEKEKNKTKQIS